MSAAFAGLPGWSFVGLGGNLGSEAELAARFTDAVARLERLGGAPARVSAIVRTAPVGPIAAQPRFSNAVVALPWEPADPEGFLAALLAIEAAHGRVRTVAQGPRTLDLDVLYLGARVIATTRLTVPHPRIAERPFVVAAVAALVAQITAERASSSC